MICDFWGLVRVCGAPIAMRWIFSIVANFAAILDRKDLQPADRAVGGPFSVRLTRYGVTFRTPMATSNSRVHREPVELGGLVFAQPADGYARSAALVRRLAASLSGSFYP